MSDNAKQIFAQNLRRYMKERGMTQQDIAEYMGCSGSTVSDWCNGNKYPRVDKMQRLADRFGITMSELTAEQDPLDSVDVAFYGDYKQLDEHDKAILRDMVKAMRARSRKPEE